MTLNIYRHFLLQIPAVGFPSCSDPRVLKYLACCVALLGVHYQQPGDEVFCCCYERKKRREGEKSSDVLMLRVMPTQNILLILIYYSTRMTFVTIPKRYSNNWI